MGIVDDHNLFRAGIGMLLNNMEGIQLCLDVSSGEELLVELETKVLDVILLDIEMKGMNGIAALKKILKMKIRPNVIMLSMHNEPSVITHLIDMGASSYLQKDVSKDELETAIRVVYEEGLYLNEIVSKAMFLGMKSKSNKSAPTKIGLSHREIEILELICKFYSNKKIGEVLSISERTVEGHRYRMMDKLQVKNSAELVAKVLGMNLF